MNKEKTIELFYTIEKFTGPSKKVTKELNSEIELQTELFLSLKLEELATYKTDQTVVYIF